MCGVTNNTHDVRRDVRCFVGFMQKLIPLMLTLLAVCSLHAGLGDSRQELVDTVKAMNGDGHSIEFSVHGHKGLMAYFKDGSAACHIFDSNDKAFVSASIFLRVPTYPEFVEVVSHLYPGVHFNLTVSHPPTYVWVNDDKTLIVGINLNSKLLMIATPEGDEFLRDVDPDELPWDDNTIVI